MKIFNRLADQFKSVKPLPEGTHHMQAMLDEKPYRMHLRMNRDGSGTYRSLSPLGRVAVRVRALRQAARRMVAPRRVEAR